MSHVNPLPKPKAYSYKVRKEKIRLNLIDSMESICDKKGEEAKRRAAYYDSFDLSATDPEGSYTGIPSDPFGNVPVQDADDL